MITRPTVLVLGAAASSPYGFPLGRTLIINLLTHLKHETTVQCKQLIQIGFDFDKVTAFREALDYSRQPSIDSFLEHRKEFLELGKAAIACELIPHENQEAFCRTEQNYTWYEYLWSRMEATPDTFKDNKLSIVTFNYDRSLEQYLISSLMHSYGLTKNQSATLLLSIPIIHLYGQLGELPYLNGIGRPYDPAVNPTVLQQCIDGIKIIHDKEQNEAEFERAFDRFQMAECIFFLGFGYHPMNVKRLRLEEIRNLNEKVIEGTAWERTPAEQELIQKLFPKRITLHNPYAGILEALRQSGNVR